MARPISPKSNRQLAIKNGIKPDTLRKRLKRGWERIDALIVEPKVIAKKVTDEQIIECEKLGMTIRRSAFFLGVAYPTLNKRIDRLGINWRGKGEQVNR